MVVVSYSGKEINAKLVYYGAGLSGKTTNLEAIYEAVPETSRGKMVSMKTQSDRTLFFDLLPLELGEILGFKTRFLLYTVPGQVFYNATRKLVLKGADAIVFVADSEVGKMEENKESLANLRANLAEYKVNLDDVPWVIQYNKRDLPNVYSIEELNAELNAGGKVPFYEAVATQGKGVFETFRGVSHLLMEKVTRDLRRSSPAAAGRSRGVNIEETTPGGLPPVQPVAAPAQAAPMSLSQAMAREAKHTVTESHDPGGVDYGREIELPGEIPPRGEPQRAPIEMEPATPLAMASHAAEPRRAASAPNAPAPVQDRDEEIAIDREEPSFPPAAKPAPAKPAPRAAAAVAQAPAPAPAAPSTRVVAEISAQPTVVPVKLKAGETLREIVIRIVVSEEK